MRSPSDRTPSGCDVHFIGRPISVWPVRGSRGPSASPRHRPPPPPRLQSDDPTVCLYPVKRWLRKHFLRGVDNEQLKKDVLDKLDAASDMSYDGPVHDVTKGLRIIMLVSAPRPICFLLRTAPEDLCCRGYVAPWDCTVQTPIFCQNI